MDNLWAAWRRDFILGPKEDGCVFCKRAKSKKDRENLLLYRGKKVFIIMNKYPYNGGHLLIVPYSHKSDITKLTQVESDSMFNLTRKSVEIIRKAMSPHGFNIGMNLGAVAGAGIEDHLHIHIVPRFKGDTNFISVCNQVRVQSVSMEEIYDILKPGFDRLKGKN